MKFKMWERYYESRKVTAEQAISTIQTNQSIIIAPLSNEPQTLVEQLVEQRHRIQNATIYTMVQGSQCIFARRECLPYFKIRTFLSSPLLQTAFKDGECDYIPMNMSKIPEWIKQKDNDTVLIQISPPNEKGFCCLGISVDYIKTAIQYGKNVIAEVNSNVPWTFGDTAIHVNEIDAFVLTSRPLLEMPLKPLTEVERKIGENVAELIPNGSTFQIGIGNISESVLLNMENKKDLGIHTGTFTDGIINLIEKGVITNKYKNLNKGKIIATNIAGTKKLYDFVHNNPLIELYPVDYTHHISTISKFDNFYSINSALEVDITGQINAEKYSSYPIAGVGGQMDFIKGSQASLGGKSIIALPSTAKNNSISRITNKVAYVTSLKTDIDYVVTEYGVARLFGKSLNERFDELISIAHPIFRKELRAAKLKV
jgi:4-hydroxybutyrate CoA-transferase